MSIRRPEFQPGAWRVALFLALLTTAPALSATEDSSNPTAGAPDGTAHNLDASNLNALPEASGGGYRLQATIDLTDTAQAAELRLQPGTLAVFAGRVEFLHEDGFE